MKPLMFHKDDVPWHDAKVPCRLHRCRPKTTGFDAGLKVERCACGASRCNGGSWIGKNETRKGVK